MTKYENGYLEPDDLKTIYLNGNKATLIKISDFADRLADEFNVSVDQIKEFFLNQKTETFEEKNYKSIASTWNQAGKEAQEEYKEANPDLDYDRVQSLADSLETKSKESIEKTFEVVNKVKSLLKSEITNNNNKGFFNDLIDILDCATNKHITKEILENTSISILLEMLFNIILQTQNETSRNFLINRGVKYVYTLVSPILNSTLTGLKNIMR